MNLGKLLKGAASFTAAGFVLLLFTTNVSAQDVGRLDLTVSPVSLDYKAQPKQTIQDKIRIHNNSSSPVDLKLEIKKISGDDKGDLNISDPTSNDAFAKWVKFDKDKITAKPNEWTDVPFTIEIPEDAAFGYYFAITATQDDSMAPSESQPTAKLLGSVAVPVLMAVKKEGTISSAEIADFKVDNFITEVLPVKFEVTIKNKGNVHLKPLGNIFIKGRGGDKELAILQVNEENGSLLPQSARTYASSWNDGFLVNETKTVDGKEVKNLKVNWNKLTDFRIGPYTAKLLVAYDTGSRDELLEKTISFWVIPYKLIGGALVILIILILVIRWMLKSYVRSQMKKNS